MKFTGEFFIPPENSEGKFDNHELLIEHKHRYLSILKLAKDKIVLDMACGEGYGSNILSGSASQVYSVDINAELIEHASKIYRKNNISFLVGAAEKIPMPDHSVDLIVSFETLEHLPAGVQIEFMAEAKRVLKPNGIMAISTPEKKNYTERYNHHNEFHQHELYKDEFEDLLKKHFAYVNLYEQGFEVTSLILNKKDYDKETSLSCLKVDDKAYNFEGKYLIALCSDSYENANISISGIIPESERSFFSLVDRIVDLQHEVEKLGAWGRSSSEEIDELRKRVSDLQRHTDELGKWGKRSAEETETLRNKLNQLQQQFNYVSEKAQTQVEFKKPISEKVTEFSGWTRELKESENLSIDPASLEKDVQKTLTNHELRRDLEKKGKEIEKLESARKELESRLQEIYYSDGYKLLSKYYRIKAKLLPKNSKAYLLLRSFVRVIKTGKLQVRSNYNTVSAPRKENNFFPIPDVPDDIKFPLAFPVFDQPLVSIIVPAYNNWVLTRNCLISIYKQTNDVTYEIIVGDNVSTDETVNFKQYFTNVNYIRNRENLGYIRNINSAARQARGKYILTLNNDTTVTPNWLSSMIDVMDKDPSVGLVGSKLIFPDGSLQEAGGIIWIDGTGWNYGRGKDPEASEYNYLKEVDYISGASNLIRKEIWDRLKGLDERYVPAYFDDSDLAFSIRDLGYKVIYQPLSVVIHYEGVTHGTNTSSGTKKYQALNATKFIEKWNKILNKDHFIGGKEVFVARDRSRYKKTILVIDHYVPQFDKDAGSRTTFQLLQLFTKLNYNVKFIGDNFFRHEPYTTHLQQMGIEVLYGVWYRDHWQEWISENREYIDFVYINRPHISAKYIDEIKKRTNARVIYYGHDLHYVREQRQYEIEKRPELLKSAKKWKTIETGLFRKSDHIVTLSSDEKEIIEKETGKNNVHIIPAFYYSGFQEPITNFNDRQHLLFIGGFGHQPNIDAVLWFSREVFPVIAEKLKNVKFLIVGSNAPEEVRNLQSDDINVLGYISDETLDNLYRSVKMVVIPLRYGAGVKGKTVEAMYHGVPFVTTRFGIEGLKDIQQVTESYDTAATFADAVLKLYNNNEELAAFSRNSIEYAKQNFSEDNVKNIINTVFS
jgi:GT2 family glycosyltransferase/ubiquinone/menaquinone biosynthesis C-methylase UbiE